VQRLGDGDKEGVAETERDCEAVGVNESVADEELEIVPEEETTGVGEMLAVVEREKLPHDDAE
jgi:hypothetical protein